MLKRYSGIKLSLTILVVLSVAACESTFKEYVVHPVGKLFDWDTEVVLNFIVEPDINPDDSNGNQPSPLVIRIYELADKEKFEHSQFRDIFFNDKKTLGDDFIKVHTLKAFLPGKSREDGFILKKGTAYVGLFAEFVQYKDAKFSLVIPVDEYLTTRPDVRLSYHSISIVKPTYPED